MNINIAGREYELFFGFDFIDYINTNSGLAMQGVQLGVMGTRLLTIGLDEKSPSALRTIIKGATETARQKPSNRELESWINNLLENEEEYEALFEAIIEELGKHSLVLREMGISKKDWNEARMKDKMAQEISKN